MKDDDSDDDTDNGLIVSVTDISGSDDNDDVNMNIHLYGACVSELIMHSDLDTISLVIERLILRHQGKCRRN